MPITDIQEVEKVLGLTLIIFGVILIVAGILIYPLPSLKETKLTGNPLVILPLKKNGFWIEFSPILFLILLILYLLLWYRYS